MSLALPFGSGSSWTRLSKPLHPTFVRWKHGTSRKGKGGDKSTRPKSTSGSQNKSIHWPSLLSGHRSGRTRPGKRSPSVGPELQELLRTLDLPKASELPNISKDVFNSPASAMHATVSGLSGFEEDSSGKKGIFEHKISVKNASIGEIEVVGNGSSPAIARGAAYLHFLAAVHSKGMTASVFGFTKADVDREKHALLDVYLFAARYHDIPVISKRSTKSGRFEVDISLSLWKINVTGAGRNAQHAEIAASLYAKQAMEQYVLKNADSDRRVKEEEVFGFASADAFCYWYRLQNRSITMSVESKQYSGQVVSKIIIQDKDDVLTDRREFASTISLRKKEAEDLAHFIVAVTLTREEPSLRERFFEEYRRSNNQIMSPMPPLDLEIRYETVAAVEKAIKSSCHATEQLEEDDDEQLGRERIRTTMYRPLTQSSYAEKCTELRRRQEAYESREDLAELRKTRSEYPMNRYAQKVLNIVHSNVYSIVIGATGSGKTTQVPQILLKDAVERGQGASCNIICTQPRRIAAKSVSRRVADERAEFVGDCIGYHVKKDLKLPSYGGSINFCTTGILTQQLQSHSDDILDNVSHIIIDEVHERDTIIDFLLTNLKRMVRHRIAAGKNVPHIILMSATIDADLFSNYLKMENAQGETVDCPTLFVPGRTFPVKEFYLDDVMLLVGSSGGKLSSDRQTADFLVSEKEFVASHKISGSNDAEDGENLSINWNAERRKATNKTRFSAEEQDQALVPHALAASTISHIANTTEEGAILTFLPGLEDITRVNEFLQRKIQNGPDFNDASKYKIFLLHSSIQETQNEVFDPVPEGCRKIILATNIAETSITIPDVQYVVDTGKVRELQYDQLRRITKLACVWVSKSSAKQRAGRAGRVQDGNYYALYSKERYNHFRAVGLPELLRSDLQEVCLDIKNQGLSIPIREFLSEAIEPPAEASVDNAIKNLVSLRALNNDESLTPLGKLLSQLPVYPSLGKMIVLGIVFRCLDPMLIIGSSFSERDIFATPIDLKKQARERKHNFCRNTLSDHIGLLAAVKELRLLNEVRGSTAMRDYALRNFLHMGAFRSILNTAETIENLLVDQGVIPRTSKIDRAHFQFGDPRLNENSDKVGLIKALVLAGFYPNLAARRTRFSYRTCQEKQALVHPASINATDYKTMKSRGSDEPFPPSDRKTELLTFSELARSNDGSSMYLRHTTPVTGLMSALFSEKLEQTKSRNIIHLDGWLPFYFSNPQHAVLILQLHRALKNVTTAAFKDLAARRILTEHHDRNHFADSLVEVLDSDLAYSAARSNTNTRDYKMSASGTDSAPAQKQTGANNRPFSSGHTHKDPKNQESWDNLIASWIQKGGERKSTTEDSSAQRPSVASLFAEGHAGLRSSARHSPR